MAKFIIEGGHRLSGTITPQGAKNEALEVISAVLLTSEPVKMTNIPEILDVKNLRDIGHFYGLRGKENRADNLQRLILCALWSDGAAEPMAALYDEFCHCLQFMHKP